MSNYRRSREGQVFFFTVVTDQRCPILTTDVGRACLRESINEVRTELPFDMIAFVLLPDNLHTVWELPRGDQDYSTRWRMIKTRFTKKWRNQGGTSTQRSTSRIKRGEQGIWQRRFFEHTCRDEEDLKRCLDYLHINPLKHGLVEKVSDWSWSTFHRYVREGEYPPDWGSVAEWHGNEFKAFE